MFSFSSRTFLVVCLCLSISAVYLISLIHSQQTKYKSINWQCYERIRSPEIHESVVRQPVTSDCSFSLALPALMRLNLYPYLFLASQYILPFPHLPGHLFHLPLPPPKMTIKIDKKLSCVKGTKTTNRKTDFTVI